MTQVGEALKTTGMAGLEALRAKNREIAVRCDRHGEFSHSDMAKFWMLGVRPGECPRCHEERQKVFLREQQAKKAVHFFSTASGVPARFQGTSLDDYVPENEKAEKVLSLLREYAEKFEQHRKLGLSLILCGKTGTGKTHLACAVLRYLAEKHGVCGKYTTAYRAVQEIRASYKSHDLTELQAMDAFISPDMLVLDEIGVQYGTESEQLLLFTLLNGRYEAMRPSIVISNLTVSEVSKYLGDRVYDRLRENGGGVLAFDWQSFRTKGLRK